MTRFLRVWLVPILAALMLVGFAAAMVPLSQREEACARTELSSLLDAAFLRLEQQQERAEPAAEAAAENLVCKAAAVARFLAHDDALLDTDALIVLCEQLSVDRIDVADADGALIASSEEDRIGLALSAEEEFAWTLGVIEDPTQQLTQTDGTTKSLLYACVPRTDIEGYVLVSRNDPSVAEALADEDVDTLASTIAFGSDLLFETDQEGTDGFFHESGSLCLRRTEDGVTLIAAREDSDIYAVRNAAMVSFATFILCVMVLGVAFYLVHLEPAVSEKKARPKAGTLDDELPDGEESGGPPVGEESDAPEEAEDETERETANGEPEPAADAGEGIAAEFDAGAEPRQIDRTGRKKRRVKNRQEPPVDEGPFDKIVD